VKYKFLQFIYEVRRFIPNSGYGNGGHFSDGHYERERKWIDKIDSKYGNKFSQLIPNDKRYGRDDYSPAVNSIWVEIEVGFDPNYDKKFHYPKYGTNEYYLVS
jgi:hypothetical protein